jgi:transcriptional regulator of nitric oxide reductase
MSFKIDLAMRARSDSIRQCAAEPAHRLAAFLFVTAFALIASTGTAASEEGVFLKGDAAPRAVFPDADRIERQEIHATDDLRAQIRAELDGTTPSIWEAEYVAFKVWHGETLLGRAFLVEEIGKHRPITFVVGVRPDGHVQDVAVVAYREAYGGEIRHKRFLTQYRGKDVRDSLQPRQVITNIAGATLSVNAASRAVKKALALAAVTSNQASEGHLRAGLPQ